METALDFAGEGRNFGAIAWKILSGCIYPLFCIRHTIESTSRMQKGTVLHTGGSFLKELSAAQNSFSKLSRKEVVYSPFY